MLICDLGQYLRYDGIYVFTMLVWMDSCGMVAIVTHGRDIHLYSFFFIISKENNGIWQKHVRNGNAGTH